MSNKGVAPGSRWWDGKENMFVVLDVVETDGHMWVHYREDSKKYKPVKECKEYSCYLESFTQRFDPRPE